MEKQEVDYFYLSASAYAKQTGIGEAEAKKQFVRGELEGFKTNNQYKIKVYKNGSIPLKQYESLLQENVQMKMILDSFRKILAN